MAKTKKFFIKVNPRQNFPELEEQILDYWQKNKIEEEHLSRNKGKKTYVFYDGPPTANGKPHIGHVITRTFKDFFPRYKTMRGYHVIRKAGWDTHGLPVEVAVEKELGINSKEEIENIVPGNKLASIKKFNALCRENVWKYIELWEKMVKRVGHFIDMHDPYITYNRDYIESVWWSLKKLFEKDLLYLGYKVVPYCTRCETPLSSHELAQDYKEVTDNSVYVKFPLKEDPNTKLLAWTTTPWTLPGNVALAVDPQTTYVKIKENGENLILAQRAAVRLGITLKKAEKLKGKALVNKKYQAPYSYLSNKFKQNKNLHTVVEADFVTTEDGSGIVHTAVMYGADDFELGKKLGLPMYHLVDEHGKFKNEVKTFAGLHVHEANPKITKDLKQKGLLWREEKIKHQYPFCWRCHSPLIYYALESWFIRTTQFKKELQKNNASVNWVPEHVGKGRMKNWYETLVDWSLSRNRYWGTPLPVWRCQNCDHKEAIGSLQELKDKAVSKHDWDNFDLHRPWVDEVELRCGKCGKRMKRVSEVIDVWYDSGSMPFAQWHYPHKKQKFAEQFPADFISEAVDQTRGWFFSLQAISTMLMGQTPYKNVVVFEHALDPKGKKMSKHIGNVLDPWEAFAQHGADATRWFFLSAVPVGTPYRVSLETIIKHSRNFMTPLWNSYNFFVTYANLNHWHPDRYNKDIALESNNILDKWIISRLNKTIKQTTFLLDQYDTYKAAEELSGFVEDFSNWYIRRSRERLGVWNKKESDKKQFFQVTYHCLVQIAKQVAPFMPFISEEIYRNLTGQKSVHLSDWPSAGEIDEELLSDMSFARKIVEKGHSIRKQAQIPVRQPLSKLTVKSSRPKLNNQILELVKQELNLKDVLWQKSAKLKVELDTKITPELKNEAETRKLIRDIQLERKKKNVALADMVEVSSPWLPEDPALLEWIKEKTGAKRLTKGKFSVKLSS